MSKIYPLLFILFASHAAISQNAIIRDNELVVNPYPVSPSYTGYQAQHEFFASYINHFAGVAGAPNSAWANYNGHLTKGFGIGVSFRFDQAGAIRKYRVDISAAYHAKIGNGHKLSAGWGVNVSTISIDFSNSNSDPINDPQLNSQTLQNGLAFNANLGLTYTYKTFGITIAAPALIPMAKSGNLFLLTQPLHLRAHSFYDIRVGRKLSIKPQVALDYILKSPINYNAIVSVKYANLVWVNAGFGAQNIISAGLGTCISGRFSIQYTFKHGLNTLSNKGFGSHEICMGVLIGKPNNSSNNTSTFIKTSKIPYHDWE